MTPGQAAAAYVARGCRVLPLHHPDGPSCSCGKLDCPAPAKHPVHALVPHGLKDATRNPAVVAEWWRRWPRANVGLVTSAAMFALDVDGPVGRRSLVELEESHGELVTCTSTTGRGMHLWLTAPGREIRNRVALAPGLDLRGSGGYCVVPPSVHMTGVVYEWARRLRPAPAPDWLVNLIVERPEPPAPVVVPECVASGERARTWALAGLERLAREAATSARGTRNATLNRCACSGGRLVGAGFLTRDEVVETLASAGRAAGLRGREVRQVLRPGGAVDVGAQHPSTGPSEREGVPRVA